MFLVLLFVVIGAVTDAQHDQHQPSQPARPRPGAPGSRLPTPETPKLPPNLGWEPIRCWRQSSAGAVAIGETFTLTLTCAVHDADNAQVIPDESRLGVASIQLAPFEILGGSHPPDVRRGTRRFFQYDYQLRLIGPDAIGRDVVIPALTISYRIHSRVGAAATLEGRDLSYLLPMMPIKVLSLVPADADDIRDASEASFASIESLRFRSNLFRVLTLTFVGLAAAMAVLAFVPLARKRRAVDASDRDRVPAATLVHAAARELAALQGRAAADGWTGDTIARALAAMRLIAATAIGHPISEKTLAPGAAVPEGRLGVSHGLVRKTVAAVSSSVTAADIARARIDSSLPTTRRQQLEGLQDGLATLGNAIYQRASLWDPPAIDEAVRHAAAVAKDVAGEHRSWLKR